MLLVPRLEAAEDRDGVLHRGLAHHDRLEAPLERGVLLDVLAVLVERGGADAAQITARELGLEEIRRVHRAFGGAGADDRVQLVDEADDLAVRLRDLLEHGLQPVLELAAILRAGDDGADVERDQPLVLERLGHVARHDAQGQALDDGGLADAGLTDEDRVVLRAAREHLDDAADLLVTADDGIELALARQLGEVAGVALERLVLLLRILIGDPLAAAYFLQRLVDTVGRDTVLGEHATDAVALAGKRPQQVLRRHVLVLEALGLGLSALERRAQPLAEVVLATAAPHGGQALERLLERTLDDLGARAELGEDRADHTLALLEQRQQQVLRLHRLVVVLVGQRLRRLHRLLGLDGEFFESDHGSLVIRDTRGDCHSAAS